jgi:hypothetical protein
LAINQDGDLSQRSIEADHGFIYRRPTRFAKQEQPQRLKQIRFTGAVRAIKEVNPFGKFQMGAADIAKSLYVKAVYHYWILNRAMEQCPIVPQALKALLGTSYSRFQKFFAAL